jgi:hypothetical protein
MAGAPGRRAEKPQELKVFWFFSLEKNILPCFLDVAPNPRSPNPHG